MSKHQSLRSSVSAAFMKTSSESVTGAIRTASIETGRKGVLRCGFTGWHDVQHAFSPSWHLPPGHRGKLRNTDGLRGVANDEKVYNWISLDLNDLAQLLKENGHTIACFIFDVFQLSFIDLSVLSQAIELCRSYGILIIIDETKTAGRIGPFGKIGQHEALWDMLILGKAIGNGTPISLLLVKEQYRTAVSSARIGGTHSKELFSVHSALTTLQLMEKYNGYEKIGEVGTYMASVFASVATELEIHNMITLKPVFGGGILDVIFDDTLYQDFGPLRMLQNILLDNHILHLVGHPSFVSLSHVDMNDTRFKEGLYRSLSTWKNRLSNIKH